MCERRLAPMRRLVDELFTGEDIAMNFVVFDSMRRPVALTVVPRTPVLDYGNGKLHQFGGLYLSDKSQQRRSQLATTLWHALGPKVSAAFWRQTKLVMDARRADDSATFDLALVPHNWLCALNDTKFSSLDLLEPRNEVFAGDFESRWPSAASLSPLPPPPTTTTTTFVWHGHDAAAVMEKTPTTCDRSRWKRHRSTRFVAIGDRLLTSLHNDPALTDSLVLQPLAGFGSQLRAVIGGVFLAIGDRRRFFVRSSWWSAYFRSPLGYDWYDAPPTPMPTEIGSLSTLDVPIRVASDNSSALLIATDADHTAYALRHYRRVARDFVDPETKRFPHKSVAHALVSLITK
jgi:hypothetical protein